MSDPVGEAAPDGATGGRRGRDGPRYALACLALAVAVAGCASFDPHGVYQRLGPDSPTRAPSLQALDPATRAEGFDRVWRTLRERYVDASMHGTDWSALGERYRRAALEAPDDTGYWMQLDALAGELRDGHTRVESPRQIQLRERHGRQPYGFDLRLLEGRLIVSGVDPRSPAAQAGVQPGLELLRADGADATAAWLALRRTVRPSSTPQAEDLATTQAWFGAWSDAPVVFEFAPAPSATASAPDSAASSAPVVRRVPLLRRELPSTRVASRVLSSGFGYLAFGGFESRVEDEVLSALRSLRATPGLIVDLRGNRGGSFRMAQRLAGALVPSARDYGRTRTRTGEPVTMHFGLTEVIGRRLRAEPPAGGAYAGPVVVLIDSASASGSELMAGALRAMGRARLIGQTSCGCLLGVLGPLPLPGGGRLSFSEVDFELEGLPRIEGAGLQPDESVPATLADLQRGHDAALTAAEAWLQQAVRKMGADPTSLPTSRPTPLPTPRPAS